MSINRNMSILAAGASSTGGLSNVASIGIGMPPSSYANQTTVAISGTTYGRLDLASAGTVYGSLYAGSGGITLSTGTALPVMFETSGTERARIDSSGNLMVGTTSYTTGRLVVQAKDTAYGGIQVVQSGAAAYWTQNVDSLSGYTWGKSGSDFWYAGRSGSNNCVSVNGSWVNSSDARLKTNIITLVDALSKVCSLRGVSFDRINDGPHEIGLIAQEVQIVYPEVIETSGEHLGLNYGALTGALVEAIKSQQALITDLTTRLAALEAK